MAGRGRWSLAALALAALVLGFLVFGPDEVPDGDARGTDPEGGAARVGASEADGVDSPFATTDPSATAGRTSPEPAPAAADTVGRAGDGERERALDRRAVDLQTLGREPISDEEFEALVERLSRDPALLQALIDEFRSESDPRRLERLSQLLGDVDDPSVVLLATELVYSGDESSRLLGLDLLKRVRPNDPDVRDVVSGLLSSESEGRILVGALTAMARPGAADADTRAGLAEQVSLLTRHADASVRRTSIDILSRWSDSPAHTPVLVEALGDGDQAVRRTAAYALVDREGADRSAVDELFAVIGDEAEEERTRRAAILALKSLTLEPSERERVLETRAAPRSAPGADVPCVP